MVYVETRRDLGLQGVSTILTAVIAYEETESHCSRAQEIKGNKESFWFARRQQKPRILTATMGAGAVGYVGLSGGIFLVPRSFGH
jgi:hypothetical protein